MKLIQYSEKDCRLTCNSYFDLPIHHHRKNKNGVELEQQKEGSKQEQKNSPKIRNGKNNNNKTKEDGYVLKPPNNVYMYIQKKNQINTVL